MVYTTAQEADVQNHYDVGENATREVELEWRKVGGRKRLVAMQSLQ
jgi:hypothetical protein